MPLPPPPPGPPPPPAAIPPPSLSKSDTKDRNALLGDINNCRNKVKLKKVQTNDRSGPLIQDKKSSSSSSGRPSGGGAVGGLFAGGMPQLRPAGNSSRRGDGQSSALKPRTVNKPEDDPMRKPSPITNDSVRKPSPITNDSVRKPSPAANGSVRPNPISNMQSRSRSDEKPKFGNHEAAGNDRSAPSLPKKPPNLHRPNGMKPPPPPSSVRLGSSPNTSTRSTPSLRGADSNGLSNKGPLPPPPARSGPPAPPPPPTRPPSFRKTGRVQGDSKPRAANTDSTDFKRKQNFGQVGASTSVPSNLSSISQAAPPPPSRMDRPLPPPPPQSNSASSSPRPPHSRPPPPPARSNGPGRFPVQTTTKREVSPSPPPLPARNSIVVEEAPPPPPARVTSIYNRNSQHFIDTDNDTRFAFQSIHTLPQPEPFVPFNKVYPSVNAARRNPPPPPPPGRT